jgi:DNA-binding MarR family transcriptional regulator/GNAT superfamily N-acetyltransferase
MQSDTENPIAAVRSFNRVYTKRIGAFDEGHLGSPFSLAQARVLYELAYWTDAITPAEAHALSARTGLDRGYLSRILRGLVDAGLVRGVPSESDARRTRLALTKAGRAAFSKLEKRSCDHVAQLLSTLPRPEQQRLVESMDTIKSLIGEAGDVAKRRATPVLRIHRPGDMGWIVQRHGALYAEEYGLDQTFEALVATIVARFLENYDATLERAWIAELNGTPVGSVMLVRRSKTVAQLRLLLVEPHARGHGVGQLLIDACEQFARHAGYRKIVLWTNSVLDAARHLYAKRGYRLTKSEVHMSFGHELVGETWELHL